MLNNSRTKKTRKQKKERKKAKKKQKRKEKETTVQNQVFLTNVRAFRSFLLTQIIATVLKWKMKHLKQLRTSWALM